MMKRKNCGEEGRYCKIRKINQRREKGCLFELFREEVESEREKRKG